MDAPTLIMFSRLCRFIVTSLNIPIFSEEQVLLTKRLHNDEVQARELQCAQLMCDIFLVGCYLFEQSCWTVSLGCKEESVYLQETVVNNDL